jgi:hypothetical protein
MSYADGQRIVAIEKSIAALLARVAVLEEIVADSRPFCEARQGAGAPEDDPLIASVIEALQTGRSIRAAAKVLNLDRNKVARLRQRAIAEGCLTVSPD